MIAQNAAYVLSSMLSLRMISHCVRYEVAHGRLRESALRTGIGRGDAAYVSLRFDVARAARGTPEPEGALLAAAHSVV